MFACFFTVSVVSFPAIITLNRLPRYWINIPTIPILLLSGSARVSCVFAPNKGCLGMSFHPAADYALWYIRLSGTNNFEVLQVFHFYIHVMLWYETF